MTAQVTFDISLLWSENQTTKEHFSRLVIERKNECQLMMRYSHGAPLERGNLDMSHSINMSILWIERMDSTSDKCYVLKELFRQGKWRALK